MQVKYTPLLLLFFFISGGCSNSPNNEDVGLTQEIRTKLSLIPLPASIDLPGAEINIQNGIYVVPALQSSKVVEQSLERFITHMRRIGVSTSNPSGIQVNLEIENEADIALTINTDESYRLELDGKKMYIKAANFVGLNHGLVTLGQLLHASVSTKTIPEITIVDKPRYPWRGVMIDVSRHWIPKRILLRNIDAMVQAKMNVMHLHLSDDQGFRVESKLFPKLHLKGSNGQYFTQDDISEIIDYAHVRGIRVIPEFDMPGHTTSWLAGYPEIGSKDEEYEVAEGYGVFPNTLNPASLKTFIFVKSLIQEMSGIFPDEYFHIGGDEILYDHWKENEGILKFMSQNNLTDPSQLLAFFHLRVQKIIQDLGKKMIGWDEVIRPELAKDGTVIQSRRGHHSLFRTAKMGLGSISSSGWNLDHNLSMSDMYTIDPTIDTDYLDIEPDSINWQAWTLSFKINDLPSEGSLVLFGRSPNLRGIITMMNRSTLLEQVKMNDDKLELSFNNGLGNASLTAQLEDLEMKGSLSMSVIDTPIEGKKIGGSNVENSIALPRINRTENLSTEEQKQILGGEACLWTEWANEKNSLSFIWPRTIAIAEKLWSPQSYTRDIADMYRRSGSFSNYIDLLDITDISNLENLATELSSEINTDDMLTFMSVIEDVKYYDRWAFNFNHSSKDSLNGIADAIVSESITAYNFGRLVDQLQKEGSSQSTKDRIIMQLESWIPLYRSIEPSFKNEKLKSIEVLALALSDLSKIALHVMESRSLTNEESIYYERLKVNAQRRIDGVYLAPSVHLINLIDRFRTEL